MTEPEFAARAREIAAARGVTLEEAAVALNRAMHAGPLHDPECDLGEDCTCQAAFERETQVIETGDIADAATLLGVVTPIEET